MTNLAHIAETASLVLAAYLLGCVVAYAARYALYALRRRPASKQAPAPVILPVDAPVRRAPTPAARLARAAEEAAPVALPLPVQPEVATAPVRVTPKPSAKPKAVARPKAKRAAAAKTKSTPPPKVLDPKPAALLRPRRGKADDLKAIKGIGPKIEASLNNLGVYHFDQIAAWTKLNTEWVDGQLAFKGRIAREQWIEQAIALAKK